MDRVARKGDASAIAAALPDLHISHAGLEKGAAIDALIGLGLGDTFLTILSNLIKHPFLFVIVIVSVSVIVFRSMSLVLLKI